MKKTSLILLSAVFLSTLTIPSYAGDKDWATAGKILTGVIGVGILADALSDVSEPVYAGGCHSSYRRDHHRDHHYSRSHWVDGHYEYVEEQVWIPGETVKRWVEPVYEVKWHHGRKYRTNCSKGYYVYDTVPGHYETRTVKRWVDGYWTNY